MGELKLKCVSLDDEPMALEIINDYINMTPFLELEGSFYDPLEALGFVQNNPVDLLFIDINMPTFTGIQFIKSLKYQPLCIFTTAYSDYAIEGYALNVIDYLLKPIGFERFVSAANKALKQYQLENQSPSQPVASSGSEEFIRVKSGTKIYQIKLKEILFIEGSGNYLTIHTTTQKIMTLGSMGEMLDQLSEDEFVRIHRSYIIALKHISIAEAHQLTIGKTVIPISKTYRQVFFERFSKKGL